jgi:hypothetical protein
MKWHDAISALAVSTILWGCPPTSPPGLSQPERLEREGDYRHPPSGIRFPPATGSFRRDQILQYDPQGRNVSVAYNCTDGRHPIAATVYVYPSPTVTSFGSPPDVVAGRRSCAHIPPPGS